METGHFKKSLHFETHVYIMSDFSMMFRSCRKISPTVFASMAIAAKFHQLIFIFLGGQN